MSIVWFLGTATMVCTLVACTYRDQMASTGPNASPTVISPSQTRTPRAMPTPTLSLVRTATALPTDTSTPTPTSTPQGGGRGVITFNTRPYDGSGGVYTINVDSGSQEQLLIQGIPWEKTICNWLWSSDGLHIAYSWTYRNTGGCQGREHQAQIEIIEQLPQHDAGWQSTLVTDRGNSGSYTWIPNRATDENYGYAWSPDGQNLAFTEPIDSEDVIALYVFDAKVKIKKRVSPQNINVDQFAWSPDSQFLAVATIDGTISVAGTPGSRSGYIKSDIFVVDANGDDWSKVENTEPTYRRTMLIQWAPDSSGFSFETCGGDTTAINCYITGYSYSLDTLSLEVHRSALGEYYEPPKFWIWNPEIIMNGQDISNLLPEGWKLFHYGIVNYAPKEIWSPDGRYIVFLVFLEKDNTPYQAIAMAGDSEIRILSYVSPAVPRQHITSTGRFITYALSPDKRQLAFSTFSPDGPARIFRMEFDIHADPVIVWESDFVFSDFSALEWQP